MAKHYGVLVWTKSEPSSPLPVVLQVEASDIERPDQGEPQISFRLKNGTPEIMYRLTSQAEGFVGFKLYGVGRFPMLLFNDDCPVGNGMVHSFGADEEQVKRLVLALAVSGWWERKGSL